MTAPERIDGSVHVAGPGPCFVCGATAAEQVLDVITDSQAAGGVAYACHDIGPCIDRARAARSI